MNTRRSNRELNVKLNVKLGGRCAALLCVAVASGACYTSLPNRGDRFDDTAGGSGGTEGGDETGSDDDSGSGDGGGGVPSAPDCHEVGPRGIRRLTARQIRKTLEHIFNDVAVPEAQVLPDPVVHGFQVDATQAVVQELGAQQVMQYAETVADWAVANKLDALLPCTVDGDACREQIVREVGAKFFREPLADAKVAVYKEIFAQEATFDEGVGTLVAAFIQSPYFLYRRELGTEDPQNPGRFVLSDYELASNLAYSLTGSPPDDALLALAEEGRLRNDDGLGAAIDTLVLSEDGQENLERFVEAWLEIEDLAIQAKDEEAGLDFSDELRADMLEETTGLFRHVFSTNGDIGELFSADYTFVNRRLGQFYRMWEASSEEHAQQTIPTTGEGVRSVGILGHGSILARHALADNSSPVARGVLVRRRILCDELPDPPDDVNTNVPPVEGDVTNRERFEQHSLDPACSGCHQLIDPVGFAFEHYDQFGRWRDTENNQPVDATGMVSGLQGGAAPLDGLDSLAYVLADAPEVQACFSRFLAYYTYGLDGCNPEAVDALAGGDAATLRSTLEAIVLAPHFRERTD